MAKYWMWRIGAAVVPRLPLALTRPLFIAIGALAWVFAGEARQRAERNLRHVPSLAANTARLHAAVRSVFVTSALNYLDFLRGRYLTNEEVHSGWTVEHEELLDEAADEGRGVVILSAHLGNFEFAASRLAYRFKMITPSERMHPERLFDLFLKLRNHHNMRAVPGDSRESLREMTETLRGGGILVIVADRHLLGTGAQIEFFGEPSTFATAPMALALRTGAPIICVYSWRTGPGRSHGVFSRLTWEGAPVAGVASATPRSRGAEQTLPALRAYVQWLEQVISLHPEAWVSALASVWEAPADLPARAGPPAVGSSEGSVREASLTGTSIRGVDIPGPSSIE